MIAMKWQYFFFNLNPQGVHIVTKEYDITDPNAIVARLHSQAHERKERGALSNATDEGCSVKRRM